MQGEWTLKGKLNTNDEYNYWKYSGQPQSNYSSSNDFTSFMNDSKDNNPTTCDE